MKKNYEHNVNEAISILPKMQFGLDVNLRFKEYFAFFIPFLFLFSFSFVFLPSIFSFFLSLFSHTQMESIKDFEYTSEMIIFDLLDIDLVHGWLPDPQEKETYQMMSTLSYNQVQEKLIELAVITSAEKTSDKSSSPPPVKTESQAEPPQPTPTEPNATTSPLSPPAVTTTTTEQSEPIPAKNEDQPLSDKAQPSTSPKLEEKLPRTPSKRFTNSPSRLSPLIPSKTAIEEKRNSIKPEDHERILFEGFLLIHFSFLLQAVRLSHKKEIPCKRKHHRVVSIQVCFPINVLRTG